MDTPSIFDIISVREKTLKGFNSNNPGFHPGLLMRGRPTPEGLNKCPDTLRMANSTPPGLVRFAHIAAGFTDGYYYLTPSGLVVFTVKENNLFNQ